MKAVVYKKPYKVEVDEVEDARIKDPTDVVIRVTSTAICGSDLQYVRGPYRRRAGHQKGLRMGTGQCNVKRYNRALRDLVVQGRVKPSFVVSKTVSLEEAPDAYERFDNHEEGYSKVVLKPGT